MRRSVIAAAVVVAAGLFTAPPVAADSTGTHGQPSQSCQSFFGDTGPLTPGGFDTSGFNHATTVYAGAQPQNSGNPMSVSQYDVACFQAAQH